MTIWWVEKQFWWEWQKRDYSGVRAHTAWQDLNPIPMLDDDGIHAIALKTATAVTFEAIFSGVGPPFTSGSETKGENSIAEVRFNFLSKHQLIYSSLWNSRATSTLDLGTAFCRFADFYHSDVEHAVFAAMNEAPVIPPGWFSLREKKKVIFKVHLCAGSELVLALVICIRRRGARLIEKNNCCFTIRPSQARPVSDNGPMEKEDLAIPIWKRMTRRMSTITKWNRMGRPSRRRALIECRCTSKGLARRLKSFLISWSNYLRSAVRPSKRRTITKWQPRLAWTLIPLQNGPQWPWRTRAWNPQRFILTAKSTNSRERSVCPTNDWFWECPCQPDSECFQIRLMEWGDLCFHPCLDERPAIDINMRWVKNQWEPYLEFPVSRPPHCLIDKLIRPGRPPRPYTARFCVSVWVDIAGFFLFQIITRQGSERAVYFPHC